MYLQKFTIQGIKCFDRVELEFPHVGEDYSGWVVLLGGNGRGKSTLLQAMAIALRRAAGRSEVALEPRWLGSPGAETRRVFRVSRQGR